MKKILSLLLTITLLVGVVGTSNVQAAYFPGAASIPYLGNGQEDEVFIKAWYAELDENGSIVYNSDGTPKKGNPAVDDSKRPTSWSNPYDPVTGTYTNSDGTTYSEDAPWSGAYTEKGIQYDTANYIYEARLPRGSVYAEVTLPEVRHALSSDNIEPAGCDNDRIACYWIGEYVGSMSQSGVKNWGDFTEYCHPTWDNSDTDKVRQDWTPTKQTTFFFTADGGAKQFIYICVATGSHWIGDAAYKAGFMRHGELTAIIGIVFSDRVWYDTNGGEFVISDNIKTADNDEVGKKLPYLEVNVGYEVTYPKTVNSVTYYPTAQKDNYTFEGWYLKAACAFDEYGNILEGVRLFDKNGEAVDTASEYNRLRGTDYEYLIPEEEPVYWEGSGDTAIWKYEGDATAVAGYIEQVYYIDYDFSTTSVAYNSFTETHELILTGEDSLSEVASDKLSPVGSCYDITLSSSIMYEVGETGDSTLELNMLYDSSLSGHIEGRFPWNGWLVDGTLYDKRHLTFTEPLTSERLKVLTATAYFEDVTVILPTLKNTGYTFKGWSDGTNLYEGGSAYAIKTSGEDVKVELEAQWEHGEYNLTFDLQLDTTRANPNDVNLPAGYEDSTTLHYRDSYVLKSPALAGYTFNGWYTADSPDSLLKGTYTLETMSDVTLYADWTEKSYNISYILNNGSKGACNCGLEHNPKKVLVYDEFCVPNPTKYGCTFAGWKITGMDGFRHTIGTLLTTAKELQEVTATKFKSLRADSNDTVKLEAVWNYSTYDIAYRLDGGEFMASDCDVCFPETVAAWQEFHVPVPVKSGYTFGGWTITGIEPGEALLGNEYADASTVSNIYAEYYLNLRSDGGLVTFSANWIADTAYVIFYTEQGTMTGDAIQNDSWTLRSIATAGTGFKTTPAFGIAGSANVPDVSLPGYSFNGFYSGDTQAFDSSGAKVKPSLFWSSAGKWLRGNAILKALMIPNNYTIAYNLTAGEWTADYAATVTVTYDDTTGNRGYGADAVHRTGYEFLGWYDADGNQIYDADGYCVEGIYWSTDHPDR